MPTPSLTAVTSVKPIDPLLTSQLASGNNTVYTVGASKAAKLDSLVLSNVAAAGSPAVAVQVSAVPSGGTVDGTHRVGATVNLAAGDSVTYDEIRGWYPASAFINVNCSAGASIDVKLTGLEFS